MFDWRVMNGGAHDVVQERWRGPIPEWNKSAPMGSQPTACGGKRLYVKPGGCMWRVRSRR
eukprot:5071691-Prorocentrum_lima.AAC.1